MTCKDCVHNGVCEYRFLPPYAEKCEDFKDQNHLLELPCKFGGTIWIIVTCPAKKGRPESTFVRRSKLTWFNLRKAVEELGRTVFLTREEAENTLKASASAASAHPECVHYPEDPTVTGCKLLTTRLCEKSGKCSFCVPG